MNKNNNNNNSEGKKGSRRKRPNLPQVERDEQEERGEALPAEEQTTQGLGRKSCQRRCVLRCSDAQPIAEQTSGS